MNRRFARIRFSQEAVTKIQAVVIIAIVIIAASIGIYYFALSRPPSAPVTIKIGIVADVTGPLSKEGTDMWREAQLAAEEINAKGGVYLKELGASGRIELFLGDTESTNEGGMRAVEKLTVDNKVDVLIGGYSSAITLANEVVAIEHKVPYIVTGASSTLITRRTDVDTSCIFHHIAVAPLFGERVMLWAAEQLRPALIEKFNLPADYSLRVAFLYRDDAFGKGTLDGAEGIIASKDLPVEIVAKEKFAAGEKTFVEVLTKIKTAKPDFLFSVAMVGENTAIFTQARRDVGLKVIIAATENNDVPDLYKGFGEWGDYMILQSRWSTYSIPRGPTYDAIVKHRDAFFKKWGTYPGMMGVVTYEGVYVYAKAAEIAGTLDKAKIIQTLSTIEMPQMLQMIDGGVIKYSKDYRELPIVHFIQQLRYDDTLKEPRPKIVWPDSLKEPDAQFVLPDWYELGGT